MRYKNYPITIAKSDEYISPTRKSKCIFISPSIHFYTTMIRLLLSSYWKVIRNYYDEYNWATASCEFIRKLERVGVKFHITGMKYITSFEGPAVFVANHMSTMETIILPGIIQPVKSVSFVMKKDLLKVPLFGKVSGSRDPIIVGRTNPREDLMHVLTQGSEKLKAGKSLFIFPGRSRSKYFEAKKFNTLGIKLAQRNDVHIVPLALVTDAWGEGKKFKDAGKIDPNKEVKMAFGEPFKVEKDSNAAHERVLTFIKDKFIEWGRAEFVR